MKKVFLFLFLAAAALLTIGKSWATEIDGKWGLGVDVGTLLSSHAEASILRGISDRTAWILDVSVDQSKDTRDLTDYYHNYYYVGQDVTVEGKSKNEEMTVIVGPRLRKFTRPSNSFSPYWDVFAHFLGSYQIYSSMYSYGTEDTRRIGGEAGLCAGAEYFSTRWPFSVSAATNIASLAVTRVSDEITNRDPISGIVQRYRRTSGTAFSSMIRLNPTLQIRVYF